MFSIDCSLNGKCLRIEGDGLVCQSMDDREVLVSMHGKGVGVSPEQQALLKEILADVPPMTDRVCCTYIVCERVVKDERRLLQAMERFLCELFKQKKRFVLY